MAFYITLVLVLTIFEIRLDALHRIGIRGAVDAGNDVLPPRDAVSMLIQNRTLGLFVMLILQIKLGCPVVGVLA